MQIREPRFRLSRSRAFGLMAALVLPLAVGACPGPTDSTPAIDAQWSWDALEGSSRAERPPGTRIAYRCPADGTASPVWGTDVYTDDSSVCTAAVHAGKATFAQGGVVVFEMRAGQSFYQGSTRFGVTTDDWDDWPGSFFFP